MTDKEVRFEHLEANKSAALVTGESTSTFNEESYRERDIQRSIPLLRRLHLAEQWLERLLGSLNFETQGINRIPDNEKKPPSIWNAMAIWISLTMHVGYVPIGVIASEFGLSFSSAISSAVVGVCLGATLPAYTATLGPKLGLRQIATSRYSFGFWGAKLCSVLNIIVAVGFSVINTVVVGQILSTVSNYKISLVVGCCIIEIVSYALSLFGFGLIHTFERYAWIPAFVLFIVLYIQAAPHAAPINTPSFETGITLTGAWLSYMALQFSSASSWCSLAADYYCNYPSNTSKPKIFLLTWCGLTFSTLFTTILGIVLGQATILNSYPPFAASYGENGLGGLLAVAWHPTGWSKFALIVSAFTVCGSNIAINYSAGLSLQLLGDYFHAVPRFIWSLLVAVVTAILAVTGRDHLSSVINDFVSLLGYWTVAFASILLIEDYFFRHETDYDLHAWDDAHKLPWGLAAVFSLIAAYCGGGVPGMAQIWYIGPVAKRFGPTGGDVGIFMSFAIVVIVYPITRYLEKKFTGR